MYDHILVATDGTSTAARAVAYAVDLAAASGARITAVSVVPPIHVNTALGESGAAVLTRLHQTHQEAAEQAIADALHSAADHRVSASAHVAHGEPAQCIGAAADATDADLIVVGSRGVTPANHYLRDTVPLRVMTTSGRHVLMVHTT